MANTTLAPTYGNVDAFNLKSIETGGVIHEDVMARYSISVESLPFTDMVGSTGTRMTVRLVLDERLPNAEQPACRRSGCGDLVSTGGRVGNHCRSVTR